MSELDRINKYLAHAGIGSRRQCDEMIKAGRIALDGIRVETLATKVAPGQVVTIDGKPVAQEEVVYWLVNKPQGHLCTNHDPSGRPLAVDLVEHVPQRVYTVGRLDEESEGLLLLTNDGDLAFRLTHPSYCVEKTYEVQVAGHPTPAQLNQLTDGIWLSDGKARASHVKVMESQGESTWLKVVLAEGKNREIRRMLAKVGHKVLALKRVAIGPVWLDRLPKGKTRRLKPHEIEELRNAAETARKEHNRNKDLEERQSRNFASPNQMPHRNPISPNPMPQEGVAEGQVEGAGPSPQEGQFEDNRPGVAPRGRFEDRGAAPRGQFEDIRPGGPPPRKQFEDRGPGGPPRGQFDEGGPGGQFEDIRPGGQPPRGRFEERGPGGPPRGRFEERGPGGPPRGRFEERGPGGPPRGRFEERGPGGPPRGRFEERGPGGPPRGRFEERGPGGPPRGRFEERGPGGPPRGRFEERGPGGPPRGRFEERGAGGPPRGRFGGQGAGGPPRRSSRGGTPMADPIARQKGRDQRKGGKPAFRRKPAQEDDSK